ncbi:TetR/AcrR family transcriptional regulator [Actinoplanes sp. RD1]|uniref:TetR/AcrR family transcriptional regulator n=1 Tax=Actinoplanes sp. RD1 TaxID=3064538 RepID=UPI0027410EBE|nr:TetR/AcrR family transcriptional regulator [Actinoplanes sp. RD1]
MARWEPDAAGRLREAALALFVEQGFEKTTVAQITERAGLNRRTFFHHFADKREVVFAGQADSEELITVAIRNQPGGADPLDAAVAGLVQVAGLAYEQFREGAVALGRVIAASPELQERELVKRAGLAATIAAALRDRGTGAAAAEVAAWAAVAIFFVARNQWNQAGNERNLAELIAAALEDFRSATAGGTAAGRGATAG